MMENCVLLKELLYILFIISKKHLIYQSNNVLQYFIIYTFN